MFLGDQATCILRSGDAPTTTGTEFYFNLLDTDTRCFPFGEVSFWPFPFFREYASVRGNTDTSIGLQEAQGHKKGIGSKVCVICSQFSLQPPQTQRSVNRFSQGIKLIFVVSKEGEDSGWSYSAMFKEHGWLSPVQSIFGVESWLEEQSHNWNISSEPRGMPTPGVEISEKSKTYQLNLTVPNLQVGIRTKLETVFDCSRNKYMSPGQSKTQGFGLEGIRTKFAEGRKENILLPLLPLPLLSLPPHSRHSSIKVITKVHSQNILPLPLCC